MADSRRKEWDRKTNEKRNEERITLVFNLNVPEDKNLHKEFLAIKEAYGTSNSQTLKNLIIEKKNSKL